MATKADLRRMLLLHLKVIGATVTAPAAELANVADFWIDGCRAELNELGLCWWDESDIPAAVTVPLVRYIGSQSCSAFGKNGKGYEEQGAPARKRLQALKNSTQRETVRADYY
jgi:hypothetical protein